MQESAKERKASASVSPEEERAAGEAECRAKIAEMPDVERDMAERIHALVSEHAPGSSRGRTTGCRRTPRTARSSASSSLQSKFKVRYSTFGFQPDARIDDGEIWPVAYALTKLDPERREADRRARQESGRPPAALARR